MRARANRPEDHDCFTLIELLVVIAIIAVLSSLLLPTLSRAKAKSNRIKCLSNMKQAVLAVMMYADDSEDTIPPLPFLKLLEPYIGNLGERDWRFSLCRVGSQLGRLPVFVRGVIGHSAEARRRPIPPALFLDGGSSMRIKTSRVRKPSEAMLFGDCYEAFGVNHIVSPLEWKVVLTDTNEFSRHNHAAPKVHSGGSNTGLLDGHAEWVRYEKLWHLDEEGEVTHPFWYPE